MNILFTVTNLEIGGAQMFVLRLASAFADRLEKDVYIYDHNPEYRQSGILNELSPRVKILSYTKYKIMIFLTWKTNALLLRIGFKSSFRKWMNRKVFRRALKKYKINIVNSHMGSSDLISAEEIEDKSIMFIPSTHGEYELNKQSELQNVEEKINKVLSRANGIIYSADKNIAAMTEELNQHPVLIKKIHIGIPGNLKNIRPVTKKQIGIPENSFVIGMVSRGIPEKGWREAIESFLGIKHKYPQRSLYLLLIGNGNYLKKLVNEYGDSTICLLQFEKNPLDYISFIQLFDIGLLPSYYSGESVPNAVIEYLYFGKPVIATTIGEIPGMINSNGKMAGTLIPYFNNKADVKSMEVAISEYIDNPKKYIETSTFAKEAFKKFRIENCVNEYMQFFNEVLSCRKE
jgi:glycosyltransferase involved in cell wall biosynthesis